MSEPTAFVDLAARSSRTSEVPNASFVNGCNEAGSNAAGIGINMNAGAVVGTPEQFTLNDQFGNARNSQISQSIGGSPYVDRATTPWPTSGGTEGTGPDAVIQFGTLPTNAQKESNPALDGVLNVTQNSALVTLAGGWEAFTPE